MGGTAAIAGGLLLGDVVASVLAPKPKAAPPPVKMPDQGANIQAQNQLLAQQAFRTGRASTVLTTNQDTGDKLGP